MNTDNDDIERLLADILDDEKPLPTAPTPSQTVTNVVSNSGPETPKRAAEVAMDDPETFLEGLLNGTVEPAAPTTKADDALAECEPAPPPHHPEVTQRVTEPTGILGESEVTQCVTELIANDPIAAAVKAADKAGLFGDTVFTDAAEREEGAQVQPLKMPTFTADDFAETMDIRNFATLVTLNTARWHAKVKDRQAAKSAAAVNDADEGAFEVRKRLLAGADSLLKAIHKAIDEARAAHYEMTLPWSTTSMQDVGRRTGGRLLPNTLFVEYTTVMAQKKQQMQDALAKFIPAYPQLVEEAKKKLGKRFDAREYPNASSIASHFDLSFDFQPIPKGDDFKGLPQAQLAALAAKVNENTRIMAENAMQEVWMRLYDVVSKMAERLSSPDKLFHNTLVQNVRDTVRLLAHLNVTHDARVEALRKKVEKHLCQHDPKVLRENLVIRAQVAAHAQSIIEEMNNAH